MAISLADLKKMSPKVMALIVLVVFCLIGYFYYFFYLQAALAKKASLEAKLAGIQQEVNEKERIASQKDKYLREVADLKVAFKEALTKLPDKREIQPLLQNVASLGRAAGMDFLLFQPKPMEKPPEPKAKVSDNLKPSDKRAEEKKPAAGAAPAKPAAGKGPPGKAAEPEKFYDEIPVTVSLSGPFHSTLAFFARYTDAVFTS